MKRSTVFLLLTLLAAISTTVWAGQQPERGSNHRERRALDGREPGAKTGLSVWGRQCA